MKSQTDIHEASGMAELKKKNFRQSFRLFLLAVCWVVFIGTLGAFCFFTVHIFRMGWALAQHVTVHFQFTP